MRKKKKKPTIAFFYEKCGALKNFVFKPRKKSSHANSAQKMDLIH